MSTNVSQSYNVLGQAPLDAKLVFTNKQAFIDYTLNNEFFAFNFYKGMLVYLQEEEILCIWEFAYSPIYEENEKILPNNFIYPLGTVFNGLDYSEKAFNLIEIPLNKSNLGQWDNTNDERTLTIVVDENTISNVFVPEQITQLWPNAEKISFIDGNINGIKFQGKQIEYNEEFSLLDWDQLTYEIWNPDAAYIQNAKMRVIMIGENINYNQYNNRVLGNSFNEIGIISENVSAKNKNSIYFSSEDNSFDILVVDKFFVVKKLSDYYSKKDASNVSQNANDWRTALNLYSKTEINNFLSSKADISSLSQVAFSGEYSDLNNKPIIPTKTSDLENDSEFITIDEVPSSETTSDVTSTTTVGAINAGETIPAGTNIQELVEKLFDKTYYPTYVEPVHSLTNNAGLREVGSSFNITLTFNFDRGKILGKLVNNVWKEDEKQADRLGEVTSYSINGSPNNPTTFEVTTSLGINTFSGTVYYSKGPQPKDSKGNNYDNPFPAGESTKSTYFEGIYPYFYYKSKSPILASDMRDAIASGQATKVVGRSNGTIEIPFEAKGEYIAIAYPATSTTKTIWYVNALDNGEIPGGLLGAPNTLPCNSPTNLWSNVNFKIHVSAGLITQPNPIQLKNS